ncbi:endonuclease VIII [Kushneria marisflavi]|uniref:DNA-(apurinic or apyrimidinic site) lyase n=1 Tax=Kushneria marisflavi TaxID=157779 RepID=A0A240UKT5_9GAMM|nr:endonuclease VIII [Kushneria marisflavi]ART61652.1 endonuclease VIII [Kushneria marisflavi]RKD86662.1 endonuclease-8 [Kushneria marisflavi]
MPEGPEIRRIADRLGKVLAGRTIEEVWFAFDHLKPFEARLEGQKVTWVDSWGKALLTGFEDGHVIYSHNQLYGVWRILRRDVEPAGKRSPRLRLSTATHSAWLMSASDISLWHREELDQHPFLAKLGPDLLTHDVTSDNIVARLQDSRFRRRRLGALMLDQHFYAGIGNYLRSEILFFAGLHERYRPMDLDALQCQHLAEKMLEVTARAWRHAGVTNLEVWRAPMIEAGEPRGRWRHAVFNRAALPCHACGTPIERIMVTSRRLYYCPRCQQDQTSA